VVKCEKYLIYIKILQKNTKNTQISAKYKIKISANSLGLLYVDWIFWEGCAVRGSFE
jgi:hypothetical protein